MLSIGLVDSSKQEAELFGDGKGIGSGNGNEGKKGEAVRVQGEGKRSDVAQPRDGNRRQGEQKKSR